MRFLAVMLNSLVSVAVRACAPPPPCHPKRTSNAPAHSLCCCSFDEETALGRSLQVQFLLTHARPSPLLLALACHFPPLTLRRQAALLPSLCLHRFPKSEIEVHCRCAVPLIRAASL
jgi:hypothetical protein